MIRSILFIFLLIFLNCKESAKKETNQQSVDVIEKSWINLSNDNFDGWHIFQNEDGKKSGWSSKNGIYTFNKDNAKGEGNKSLLTDDMYTSFEIMFEWKLSPNSNSGFMWGVSEEKKYEHPHVTGPEIQIIDVNTYGNDPEHQIHTVGALYDMVPPKDIVAKNAGEWNKYHITIDYQNNNGKVILNGIEINNFPLSGNEWDEMVKNSKFANMSGFGKFKEGYISLQDHPGVISYKNIKIRRL